MIDKLDVYIPPEHPVETRFRNKLNEIIDYLNSQSKEPEKLVIEVGKFYLTRLKKRCICYFEDKNSGRQYRYSIGEMVNGIAFDVDEKGKRWGTASDDEIISLHPNQTWKIE